MSLSSIIGLGKQYLLLGVILFAALLLVYLLGYFIVYKKIMNGKKKPRLFRVLLYGVFIIYITVVLGVTFLTRYGGNQGGISLHMLSSYIDAWNSFSITEWRNIILNIMMFVPLGFMLPLLFKKFEKWYYTYLAGFVSTLVIETLQFVSKRGIFEIDDLINNTLGCMIGYGIVMIFILSFNKNHINRNNKVLISGVLQIPLVITVVAFVTIFIAYSKLELGNLRYTASYNIEMDTIDVTKDITLDNSKRKGYVYEIAVGNKEKAVMYANELLSKLNTSVDEKLNAVYDDTVICTSDDGNYSVWVDYLGFTNRFIDISQTDSEGKVGLTLNEITNLLKLYDINIPENVEFEEGINGNYSILIDMVKVGNDIITGGLSCAVNSNNKIVRFDNNILTLKPYKEYEIMSEEEAYNKILNGEFKDYGGLNKNSKINTKDVTLKYEIDSKGFYQPVYYFAVEMDSYLSTIIIPAAIINK